MAQGQGDFDRGQSYVPYYSWLGIGRNTCLGFGETNIHFYTFYDAAVQLLYFTPIYTV